VVDQGRPNDARELEKPVKRVKERHRGCWKQKRTIEGERKKASGGGRIKEKNSAVQFASPDGMGKKGK